MTYVPYGARGGAGMERQVQQDANATANGATHASAVAARDLDDAQERDDDQERAGPRQEQPSRERASPDDRGGDEERDRDEDRPPPQRAAHDRAPPIDERPAGREERDERQEPDEAERDADDVVAHLGPHARARRRLAAARGPASARLPRHQTWMMTGSTIGLRFVRSYRNELRLSWIASFIAETSTKWGPVWA